MNEDRGFVHLGDDVLASLGITTQEVVEAIEAAIGAQAAGRLWTAPKAALLPGDGRYMMTTLSAADDPGFTVVKSVMVSPRNPARGLDGIEGAILVQDSETGLPLAVMGAKWITAVRTAGLSAVVARRLADPASASVAFIGCGAQARSHLDAFADLFPLRKVRAFGRGRANIDRLVEAARSRGLEATVFEDANAAIEGADLVVSSVTLSYDLEPFVDARRLKPGAFAAITDLALPWLAQSLPEFGAIVIDDRAQEAASPKPMVEPALIRADLVGLVSGSDTLAFQAGRSSAFVFRGLAVGDFALASLAYSRARELELGAVISP